MVEIRLVKHRDEIEQLVDLFGISFGREISKELWEWKYISNPLTLSAPEVVVAADKDKIVGARPFLLLELWLMDEKMTAAEHCDTMVHPDYRNLGLFNRMGKFALEHLKNQGVALSYGFPGPMSRPGFLRQGYRKVLPTEILFRSLNTRRIISKRFARSGVTAGLGYVYDKVINKRIPSSPPDAGPYDVEVTHKYKADLTNLDDMRNKQIIEFARDEKSLLWRFDRHPENTYRYIRVKKDGRLSGYAVISVQEQPNKLVYGMVIDYLVENGDISCFRVLIERAIRELAREDCDLIAIWALHDVTFQRELKKHWGFKSTAGFPFNKFIDHGYLDVMQLDDRLSGRLDVYNAENWRITYAFPDFT